LVREVDLLAADWLSFEETALYHPFQRFAWISAWQRHVGAERGIEPRIAVVRSGTDVACILPLGLRRSYGVRVLEWLGGEHADYQGGLFSPAFLAACDAKTFSAIWQECLSQIGEVGRVNLVKQTLRIGDFANPFAAFRHAESTALGHLTDLGSDFERYYAAKRSARSRTTDRRKRKSLASADPVEFRQAIEPEDLRATVSEILDRKNADLAARGAKSPFAAPGARAFLTELALSPHARNFVWIHRLDCGGEMVAGAYGLLGRDRYYYYLHCFADGPLARFTPGRLLMYDIMRTCASRGIVEFDFTIGDEDYKSDWCERTEPLFDHTTAVGILGAAPVPCIRAGRFAKRAIRRIPGARNALIGLRTSLFGSSA
jgi:CelD/BcsL family acetyltransferase involved in cellulose biosynthesis